jgi:hypothetical protein
MSSCRAARRLAALLASVLVSCGVAEVERRAGSTLPYVSAQLPGSKAEVAAALRAFFNDGMKPGAPNKFPPDDRLHAYELFPKEVPRGYGYVALPGDFDLAANAAHDPALARYLALPPARRSDDLFLYRVGDVTWLSEYFVRGNPVPFTCHFILHLEAEGPRRTRVEVLEYLPQVRAGKKLAPTAHGVGFGRVEDWRVVPPTTRDRVELLHRIEAAVAPGG